MGSRATPADDSDKLELSEQYKIRLPRNQDLLREALYILELALEDKGIKVHNVAHRIKSAESVLEKIDRKRYVNPWQEITDIVGLRVICLFLDDLPKVDAAIREIFDILEYEDKLDSSAPEALQYRSVHYACQIDSSHSGPRYDSIKDLTFEIQTRTILQDAWAAVEHYLAYKGRASIPISLRRDFSALVGLFHVADKQFQQLFYDSQASEEQALSAVSSQVESGSEVTSELNRSTVAALLSTLYPDRRGNDAADISEFVEELTEYNRIFPDSAISNLAALREILVNGIEEGLQLEAADPPYFPGSDEEITKPRRYAALGIARITLDAVLPGYDKWRSQHRRWTKIKPPVNFG